MGLAVVGVIVLNIIIAVVLLTIFLYYYVNSFQCDSYSSFWCRSDWKCPGYKPDDDTTVILANANGDGITNDMLGCYLSSLYGRNGVDGKGNNENGVPCKYAPQASNGSRPAMVPRSLQALADTGTIDNPIAAGCNSDGDGVLTESSNPFGGLCIAGAMQNVFARPGSTKVGSPYDPCTPTSDNDPNCLNIAQLLCDSTANFFSYMTGSCNEI